MAFAPKQQITEIELYANAPVDLASLEEPAFQSLEQQHRVFRKYLLKEYKNCSYQRRERGIRLEISQADAEKCNYLSFINPNFENKRFYAQKTSWEYINNKTCMINFEIDALQTYMFDCEFHDGYIEREHMSKSDFDKIEANPFDQSVYEMLTPENVVTSETTLAQSTIEDIEQYPLILSTDENDYTSIVMYLAKFNLEPFDPAVIQTELINKFKLWISPDGGYSIDGGSPVDGGVAVPKAFFIGVQKLSSLDLVLEAIDWLTVQGLTDSIIGMYAVPNKVISNYLLAQKLDTDLTYTVEKPTDIEGYTPVNKKLLLSPFQYLEVSNLDGDKQSFMYEMFNNKSQTTVDENACVFNYMALFDGPPMTTLIPRNYGTDGPCMSYRLDMTNFPQVGYTTDAYLAFLSTQYQQNLANRTNSLSGNPYVQATLLGVEGALDVSKGAEQVYGGIKNKINPLSKENATISGGVQTAIGGVEKIDQALLEGREAYYADALRNNWEKAAATNMYTPFSAAKSAFVNDQYIPGTTNGTIPFYTHMPSSDTKSFTLGPGVYLFTKRHMKLAIIKAWDTYFSRYGYSSPRYAVPRICNYFNNVTDNTKLPSWVPYENQNVTYIKASGLHITGISMIDAQTIEQMFSSGIRFTKGADYDT